MRGDGGVYLRGKTQWIWYSRNGKLIRESAQTGDERTARKFLARRIQEAQGQEFVGPSEKRLGLEDLEKKILADYARQGLRSAVTVTHCLKALKKYFPYERLLQLTPQRIEDYQSHRLAQKKARSTVNREVRYLLHGFRLLADAREISYVPKVKLLGGETVREGFLNRPEFEAMVMDMKPDVQDIVRFLYNCSWRSGEAETLEWSKVDVSDWVIRLSRKNEKTKSPRTLVLEGELREIIERRLAKRRPDSPYVFHRNGRQIKSFRRMFESAAIAAGLGRIVENYEGTGKKKYVGVTPHDMRRSGIRNFTKAGVGESEGMSISGHKTNSVYKRYNIIDEQMQRQALQRVQKQQEKEKRKVVPLKRKTA